MGESKNRNDLRDENTRLKEENRRYHTVMENLSIHERMFHTLFESGHDAVFLLENRTIRDSNMRSVEIFQYQQEELLGVNILSLSTSPFPSASSRTSC